jgi:hypothetical protein
METVNTYTYICVRDKLKPQQLIKYKAYIVLKWHNSDLFKENLKQWTLIKVNERSIPVLKVKVKCKWKIEHELSKIDE